MRTFLMFRDTCKFIETIHAAIPLICSLLGSKNATDVLEAIKFLETALEFKISKAKVKMGSPLLLLLLLFYRVLTSGWHQEGALSHLVQGGTCAGCGGRGLSEVIPDTAT